MKKLNNFLNCFNVLKKADFDKVDDDEIYRTGVISQFNLTFELAWKALQEIMRVHGVSGAESGSPREILKLGFKCGFVRDENTWLTMLKMRNTSIHIYNENELDEMISHIRDSFINAFEALAATLTEKAAEAENGLDTP